MKKLNYYYQTIVKQDLLNKFNYKEIKVIPRIKKIVLSINLKTSELKQTLVSLSVLELISSQKAIPINKKKLKVILKTKKGTLSGCTVTLRKKLKYNFLCRLIVEIFPNLKQFTAIQLTKNIKSNIKNLITFSLTNISDFPELEANYYYFTNLSNFNITIITNAKTPNELFFLLKSFKIPLNCVKSSN